MAQFDFIFKQGDTKVVATDTLSYSDGSKVDLTGATVKFVMRALSATDPIATTGTTVVTDPIAGQVQYNPSAADTSVAGSYMAEWAVTFPDGTLMTFPTVGYLSVSIEENLSTPGGQQLVSLPEVKDYLHIPAGNHNHDSSLVDLIQDVRPIVEEHAGPIIPQAFEEWHDGGQSFIQVRRRPQTGFGTSPILQLLGVDEYSGTTKYTLSVVPDPSRGTTYSVAMDRIGMIVRRSSGGGTMAFRGGTNSVHVFYRAGQASVPRNVRRGTLELIRVNWQTTEGVGTGRQTVSDFEDSTMPPMGFFVPRRVRELLAPTRRAPSIA